MQLMEQQSWLEQTKPRDVQTSEEVAQIPAADPRQRAIEQMLSDGASFAPVI